MPAPQKPTTANNPMKRQRDRFLAFAFAAADVLLEVSEQGDVLFCEGATQKLIGLPTEDVRVRNILDLIDGDDRSMAAEMLKRLQLKGRVERVRIKFRDPNGKSRYAVVSGIRVPDMTASFYLTVSRSRPPPQEEPRVASDVNPPSASDLVSMAQKRAAEAKKYGDDIKLTLVDLENDELKARMSDTAVGNMLTNVESFLRAWSIDGASVERFEGNRFGVVHDAELESDGLNEKLSEITAKYDPAGQGMEVKTATVDMDGEELGEEDIAKALVYTINKFIEGGSEQLMSNSLRETYAEALDDTIAKVNQFRQLLASDQFTLVFQPIVHLTEWTTHHFEALARVMQGDRLILPAKFIGFAEDFGVINEFDLCAVKKGFEAVANNQGITAEQSIAINLSGGSLGNETFVNALNLLLIENRAMLPRIMFEITESAEIRDLEKANKVLQKIRAMGCPVCIDDFGAGAATFQYLKALKVDYVKIDGSYVLDAFHTDYGRPFLKSITELCREMKIKTIGEMVEDEQAWRLLKSVGVDYGQGYYWGRPIQDVTTFTLPRKPTGKQTPQKVAAAAGG